MWSKGWFKDWMVGCTWVLANPWAFGASDHCDVGREHFVNAAIKRSPAVAIFANNSNFANHEKYVLRDRIPSVLPQAYGHFQSPQRLLAKGETETTTETAVVTESLDLEPLTDLQPESTMPLFTTLYVRLLHYFHLNRYDPGNVEGAEALKAYADLLDPAKMFLTQSQVNACIERYADQCQHELSRNGDLRPGFDLANRYRQAFQKRVRWILQRLDEPFDWETNKTFTVERKKATRLDDQASLDARWTQRLQYECMHEMFNQPAGNPSKTEDSGDEDEVFKTKPCVTRAEALKNEAKARETLKMQYRNRYRTMAEMDASDIQQLFLLSESQFADPHTAYISPSMVEELKIELNNSLIGIGATLKDDHGTCIVQELIPGGPAAKSGQVHKGDKILAVAQGDQPFVYIQGMSLRKSVKMIRGAKGTVVRLKIQPAEGGMQRKIVRLVRDEVKLEDRLAFAKLFWVPDAANGLHLVGWIDVPSFYGAEGSKTQGHTITHDVRELIHSLKQFPIEGIILDLRHNGGGLLTEAVDVAGLFLNNCPVVQVQGAPVNKKREFTLFYSDKDGAIWDGPLLILTSRLSASAAEILAGALQVTHRALVFGHERTHGKGTVQAWLELSKVLPLPGMDRKMGLAKVTIQKWYLPDGSSPQQRGIRSDLSLPSVIDALPGYESEADLPHAIPWDAIQPMLSGIDDAAPCQWIEPGTIPYLMQRQRDREKTQPILVWDKKRVAELRKIGQQVTYPLNLQARMVEINQERKFLKTLHDEEKQLRSWQYPSRHIPLKNLHKQPQKEKERPLDVFEQEALNMMVDWLCFLGIHPQWHPKLVWHFGEIIPDRWKLGCFGR